MRDRDRRRCCLQRSARDTCSEYWRDIQTRTSVTLTSLWNRTTGLFALNVKVPTRAPFTVCLLRQRRNTLSCATRASRSTAAHNQNSTRADTARRNRIHVGKATAVGSSRRDEGQIDDGKRHHHFGEGLRRVGGIRRQERRLSSERVRMAREDRSATQEPDRRQNSTQNSEMLSSTFLASFGAAPLESALSATEDADEAAPCFAAKTA